MPSAIPPPPTPSPPAGRWLAAGCGIAAALLFAGKAVLVRSALAEGADATALLGLRMAFSLPCFAVIAWWLGRGRPLARGDVLRLLGLGVLGYHVASWLDFQGLRHIDAALERVVLFIYPTLVVAWAVLRGRAAADRRLVLVLLATYGGIVLTWGDRLRIHPGPATALGVALVAASAVAFAIKMILSEGILRRIGGVRAMAVAMLGACLTTMAHAAVEVPAAAWPATLALAGHGAALAILATVVPVLLAAVAMARLGAARAAILASVAPAATAAIGWLLLDERLGALGWAGIAATTAGAVLSVRR